MPKTLLIADDEPGLVALLRRYFEQNGYCVLCACDGAAALKAMARQPDLVLLDVNMPGLDGFDVCRCIRAHATCPVLLLTARTETADKLTGFSAGADDYIVKPFDLKELGARVDAHLRREARGRRKTTLQFCGEIVLDYAARTVQVGEVDIPFSKKEFDIVELLSLHAGQVFDRERIYESVWGVDGAGSSDTVMEHIRKIRAKLGKYTRCMPLETVWGIGYKWNA